MTDNEIIKALECCGKTELGNLCSGCPKFDKDNDFCQEELHEAALDLISRQKEEIEMLDINLKAMRGAANSFKAEINRLQEVITETEKSFNKITEMYNSLSKNYRIAKSEAREEFAERFKEYLRQQPKWNVSREEYKNIGFDYDTVFFGIDNIVKEMTENINGK